MPTVCCDTSFLISLYGNDVNTAIAKSEITGLAHPVSVTKLHEFEMLNAVHLAVFRRVTTKTLAQRAIAAFRNDLINGKLVVLTCDFDAMFTEANRLSTARTSTDGYRAFDILLVAAALQLGANIFLSCDARQRALAAAEGLTVRP